MCSKAKREKKELKKIGINLKKKKWRNYLKKRIFNNNKKPSCSFQCAPFNAKIPRTNLNKSEKEIVHFRFMQ